MTKIEQSVNPTAYTEESIVLRNDSYEHLVFKEKDNPELVREALRIHAEGYLTMGFINQDAVTDDGLVDSEIDHARGDSVDYYLAIKPENELDAATARKINIPIGEDFRVLPAYQLCKNTISEEGFQLISNIPPNSLKEIAGMSRTEIAQKFSIVELLRDIYQDSYGKNEVWFFSIVDETLDFMDKYFGSNNFIRIGSDTRIDDPRVKDQIRLIPVIFNVDNLLDNFMSNIASSSQPRNRNKLIFTFFYSIEGIPEAKLPDNIKLFRDYLLNDEKTSE